MIDKNIIRESVQKFVDGSDLEIGKSKHDSFIIDNVCQRMNYLKHTYLRAKLDGKNTEEIFERMCQIIPGFMLMEE